MLEHQVERILGHQLEALDAVGAPFEEAKQIERLGGAVHASPCDRARRDRRHKPQRDGSNDPEGPFGAD